MTFHFAFVATAVERFVAQFVTIPSQTVTIPFLLSIATHTTLHTLLRARRTFIRCVTWLAAHVYAT